MLILWDLYKRDKPPVLARVFAFIHTIEVFWPWNFGAELKNALRAETKRQVWDDPLIIDGVVIGWILKLNAPTKRAVEILDEMWEERMSICRLHVAYDLDPAPGISRADIRALMTRCTNLNYRKTSDRIRNEKGTIYGIDTAYRRGRLSRNWAYYDDEPGELDGECEKPHFEIREMTGDAIKRAGISRPRDLFNIKPRPHFQKRITIRDPAEMEIRRWMRKLKRSRHYDIPRNVTGRFQRLGITLADMRKNAPKKFEKMRQLDVLDICAEMQWLPAKGHEKEKEWGKFCRLSHPRPVRPSKPKMQRERL
ncbi:hypothetical protein ACVWZM_008428 [Bradyrhizobium sp. USDA 4501]